jgi:branched-chain amino acid transport system permease protein
MLWLQVGVDMIHLAIVALAVGFLLHEVGLLSLGHSACVMTGAYALVGVALDHFTVVEGLGMLLVVPILLALTTLRVREDVFAVVALAIAEGLRHLAIGLPDVTGGALGLGPLPPGGPSPASGALIGALILSTTVLGYLLIARSRIGLALGTIRDSQLLAAAHGTRVGIWRFVATVLTGLIAAASGALQSSWFGFASPELGALDIYLQAVAAALLGTFAWRQGRPHRVIAGILLGAMVVVGVPALLRELLAGAAELAMLRKAIFGLLLLLVVSPGSPLATRQRSWA